MHDRTSIGDRESDFIQWLHELTRIPTAAGHEHRVLAWIQAWVDQRSNSLVMKADAIGNRTIRCRNASDAAPPLYITAHLDHPAFVVESVDDDGTIHMTFRGTVRDPYFVDARIRLYPPGSDEPVLATVTHSEATKPLRTATARADSDHTRVIAGTIGIWDLPEQHTDDEGIFHTNACDDLAGVAAALCAMDVLRHEARASHVRLLFTRAEEVGFIGTIGVCRNQSVPTHAQLLTLETSRSFAESPIGAGPIVRIGDRLSTFSPEFTASIAHVCATLAKEDATFNWQRKLMAGGACEATAFYAFGYEATCVCLPLGNYHNQADLARVEAEAPHQARVGLEYIAVSDYLNLIRALIECGMGLTEAPSSLAMVNALYDALSWVVIDSHA